MSNLLLEPVAYQMQGTSFGTWRRYAYPHGQLFEEFTSHRRILGLPLLHYTRGICPETGKRVTARGVVAVGRFALGIIALGQVSAGFIALGQVAVGVVLGLGQATTGFVCVGQLAIGAAFALGQFTTGHVVIGQFAFGHYVLAQFGLGQHVWDTRATDPVAEQFFRDLAP